MSMAGVVKSTISMGASSSRHKSIADCGAVVACNCAPAFSTAPDTREMTIKSPESSTTFMGSIQANAGSNGALAAIAVADLDGLLHGHDKDFSIADMTLGA